MNRIYNSECPNGLNNLCESRSYDIDKKFVDEICDIFCEVLEVNYNEKRIVKSLLKTTISNKIDNNYKNEGLLQQYEEYILDKSSERIIDELNLGDVKINHSNCTHAKFNDIIKRIKELYIPRNASEDTSK